MMAHSRPSNGGTLHVYDDISGTGNWVADAGTINLGNINATTTGGIDIINGGTLNLNGTSLKISEVFLQAYLCSPIGS
jgi:hypothetical protein